MPDEVREGLETAIGQATPPPARAPRKQPEIAVVIVFGVLLIELGLFLALVWYLWW